jgi:hypothetical protein
MTLWLISETHRLISGKPTPESAANAAQPLTSISPSVAPDRAERRLTVLDSTAVIAAAIAEEHAGDPLAPSAIPGDEASAGRLYGLP